VVSNLHRGSLEGAGKAQTKSMKKKKKTSKNTNQKKKTWCKKKVAFF